MKLGKVSSNYNVFVDDFQYTSLNIKVCDNNKTAIENAIITIALSKNDSIVKTVILDKGNSYSVDNLRPDNYNIKIQSIGYMSYKLTNTVLSNNKGLYLDFELGQSDAFIQMTIKSNKKLSPRQLRRRIAKIEEELNE